ncbi:MAG: hypothetical protein HZB38_15220 [Planctomycetes bacterium]|nr:hypothetical protein [Planctomycetota bacterium]
MTLLASALGQLTQFNPTHLPFGYEGPETQSRDWMERRALERVGKQIVGLMWRHASAEAVAVAVEHAVSESIRLGFLEQRQYDAWRPGMRSGSGWRWAVTATPYGVMKACSDTESRSDAPTMPTETSAPHGVETHQRTPKGGKIGESFVEPTPVPEASVNRSAPTRPTDARDGQPKPGDAGGSASVPTNGEAPGDNPIGAWLSARRQLEDARLIGEYAQATPGSLLAQCNRMIDCIAGFDTVFLCSAAQAEQQAKSLDNDWLVGFKRVLEILLLAAVSRKIDLGQFKELARTVYSFWTGLLDSAAAAAALQGLFSPGIAQLFDLKRALMIELAQVSGEDSTRDPLVVAAAKTPAGQDPASSSVSSNERYEWARQIDLVRATNQVLGEGMLNKGVLCRACADGQIETNRKIGRGARVRVRSFLTWVSRQHQLGADEATQIRNAVIGEISSRNS